VNSSTSADVSTTAITIRDHRERRPVCQPIEHRRLGPPLSGPELLKRGSYAAKYGPPQVVIMVLTCVLAVRMAGFGRSFIDMSRSAGHSRGDLQNLLVDLGLEPRGAAAL
jgi:hypothetical protein